VLQRKQIEMRLQRKQYIIAVCGAVAALALILFPDWSAVHPTDEGITVGLGHAWILSPPAPPYGLDRMRVEPSWSGNILIAFAALAAGTVAVFLGPRKAKV
jgi:hypothetical protein